LFCILPVLLYWWTSVKNRALNQLFIGNFANLNLPSALGSSLELKPQDSLFMFNKSEVPLTLAIPPLSIILLVVALLIIAVTGIGNA